MDSERLAKLSDGQRQCLRMVLRHMSSKEIALALDISRHTVDQRLRLAMSTLGASSRIEAARLFAEAEGAGEYQRFVYQSPPLEGDAFPPPLPPPAPREERGHERLQRLGWILAIAAFAVMLLAAAFIALNALSRLTR